MGPLMIVDDAGVVYWRGSSMRDAEAELTHLAWTMRRVS